MGKKKANGDAKPGQSTPQTPAAVPKLEELKKDGAPSPPPPPPPPISTPSNGPDKETLSKKSSSWQLKPKAAPIAQLARESISASGSLISKAASSQIPSRPPSIKLPGNSSTKSLPIFASNTSAKGDGQEERKRSALAAELGGSEESPKRVQVDNTATSSSNVNQSNDSTVTQAAGNAKAASTISDSAKDLPANDSATSPNPSWLTWFSKSNNGTNNPSQISDVETKLKTPAVEGESSNATEGAGVKPRRASDPTPSPTAELKPPPDRRSWFSLRGRPPFRTQDKQISKHEVQKEEEVTKTKATGEAKPGLPPGADLSLGKDKDLGQESAPQPSGWTWWIGTDNKSATTTVASDTATKAQEPEGKSAAKKPSQLSIAKPTTTPAKGNSKTTAEEERPRAAGSAQRKSVSATSAHANASMAVAPPMTSPNIKEKEKKTATTEPENIILPPLRSCYKTVDSLSLLQQLTRLLYPASSSALNRPHLIKDPPRIRKALAFGVHGYFPTPLLRSVIGQPTGTSIKFADNAAAAIDRWTRARGYTCEIEKVALEGEGRIEERIDLLWKLILNRIDDIRRADFILMACHSQGVPVAMMLCAKLISFGVVSHARIGVCAMAGINLGPFPEFKSRWISGTAGELFEFGRPDSQVSRDYEAALAEALKFGVKVMLCGSIDDQLVSMESSTFGAAEHPSFYRAVFVDGRIHAPNFLTNLVGIALKLRNLGIRDHGLIRELSLPLAGSLYSGEGHSRVYEDLNVYSLAVEFALESSDVRNVDLRPHIFASGTAPNPYILPFAMRGVLEEDFVRRELKDEVLALLKQFDDWKPMTKALKDVKFRLEGIRSRL